MNKIEVIPISFKIARDPPFAPLSPFRPRQLLYAGVTII